MLTPFDPRYREPKDIPNLKVYDGVCDELRQISGLVLLTLTDSDHSKVVMVSGILRGNDHQLCYSSEFTMIDKKLPLDFERVDLSKIADYRLMITRAEIDQDESNTNFSALVIGLLKELS